MSIGIIGLGFVGNAIYNSFKNKKIDTIIYDKYKNSGIGKIENCLKTDILFLCLPTLYNEEKKEYEKNSIEETLLFLQQNDYKGIVVIKSTIEPTTIYNYSSIYSLQLVHNPEFLTARTASQDFHNQSHIILGFSNNCTQNTIDKLYSFYHKYYPLAEISVINSTESESIKLFLNSFYAVKVQYFNEIYLTCQKLNLSYDKIKNIMLKNNWINPMHTSVPGPDNKLSYGGMCFPKDTNALNEFMKKYNISNSILEATIKERNEMRKD